MRRKKRLPSSPLNSVRFFRPHRRRRASRRDATSHRHPHERNFHGYHDQRNNKIGSDWPPKPGPDFPGTKDSCFVPRISVNSCVTQLHCNLHKPTVQPYSGYTHRAQNSELVAGLCHGFLLVYHKFLTFGQSCQVVGHGHPPCGSL